MQTVYQKGLNIFETFGMVACIATANCFSIMVGKCAVACKHSVYASTLLNSCCKILFLFAILEAGMQVFKQS